jgi:hypothetical protein
MNEIVKFPINTPVEVTLQSEAGERVDGRYGEQVRYSLTDDRIMFVPLYVEQRFRELAIGAGEPLLLCKQQVKNGDRNRTEWSVKRAPEEQPMWVDEIVEADTVAAECILAPVEVGRNGTEAPSEHQTAGETANRKSSRAPTRLLRWHRNQLFRPITSTNERIPQKPPVPISCFDPRFAHAGASSHRRTACSCRR